MDTRLYLDSDVKVARDITHQIMRDYGISNGDRLYRWVMTAIERARSKEQSTRGNTPRME